TEAGWRAQALGISKPRGGADLGTSGAGLATAATALRTRAVPAPPPRVGTYSGCGGGGSSSAGRWRCRHPWVRTRTLDWPPARRSPRDPSRGPGRPLVQDEGLPLSPRLPSSRHAVQRGLASDKGAVGVSVPTINLRTRPHCLSLEDRRGCPVGGGPMLEVGEQSGGVYARGSFELSPKT
ncbi:hypothetical protein H1C71_037554, partial [Ictidomys tridecemlineatus]